MIATGASPLVNLPVVPGVTTGALAVAVTLTVWLASALWAAPALSLLASVTLHTSMRLALVAVGSVPVLKVTDCRAVT